VAIADAYEAMISDRPYSAAMSHADALGELERQRGVQFDPDLVDTFIALVGDGTRPPVARRLSVVAVPATPPGRMRASRPAKAASAAKAGNGAKGSNRARTSNVVEATNGTGKSAGTAGKNGGQMSAHAKPANGSASANGASPKRAAAAARPRTTTVPNPT
jgi:hypothetical protein